MTKSYDDLDDLVGSDIIDSRDLISALADYDDEIDPDSVNEDDPDTRESIKDEYGEIAEEIRALEGCVPDWYHGSTLIREDHFKDYAQQYAEDTGAVNDDAGWPNSCIDWDKAADELQADYSSVELGDHTYLVR